MKAKKQARKRPFARSEGPRSRWPLPATAQLTLLQDWLARASGRPARQTFDNESAGWFWQGHAEPGLNGFTNRRVQPAPRLARADNLLPHADGLLDWRERAAHDDGGRHHRACAATAFSSTSAAPTPNIAI